MLDLDIRTLLVVTTLASIGSAVALFFLWLSQTRRNGAGFWAIGMSCVLLASILISGQEIFTDFLSFVVANSFYVLGFVFILRGIRIFSDRPPLVFFDFVVPPIAVILFYYFYFIEQNINIRIAILSIAFITTCLATVITLLSNNKAPWRSAGFSVAAVFGLFGLFHGTRGVIALISPEHSVDPQELINLADQAMYEIKRQGKHNYAFAEKVSPSIVTEEVQPDISLKVGNF